MSDTTRERRFTPEETDTILRSAIRAQLARGRTLSESDLYAVARDLDVEPGVLHEQIERHRDELSFAAREREERRKAWFGLASHATVYVLVNIMLFVTDLQDGRDWWFFYVLLGWGIGLASHAYKVLFGIPDDDA